MENQLKTKLVKIGEYGCDCCDEIHVARFTLVLIRPGVRLLLCDSCLQLRIDHGKAKQDIIEEIYRVEG